MQFKNLPYIYIDDDFDLNLAILILLLDSLAVNTRGNYKLDFNKIQFFMYVVKNPSKINKVLEISGKKYVDIDESQMFTLESLSVNVDILYNSEKIKSLLKKLSLINGLKVINDKNEVYYSLTQHGKDISSELSENYFSNIRYNINSVKPLQSLASSKLFSILNILFTV